MFCAREPHIHSIRKARTRRKTSVTYKRLSAESKKMGGAVQINLVRGFQTFKKRINKDQLYDAFKTGRWDEVQKVVPWDRLPHDLHPAFKVMDGSLAQAFNHTIESLPSPNDVKMRYDMHNPEVRGYIKERTGMLVEGVTSQMQQAIADQVGRSFTDAMTPRQVANQIVNSIGLDQRRETALSNYTWNLIKDGKTPEQVEALSNAYHDRLLNSRAMTIARTETRLATNNAQLSVWKQAVNQGLIESKSARKVWIVDGNPCDICEPMDGVAVGLYDYWQLNNGDTVDVPSESHPNCYCGMEMEFDQPSADNSGSSPESEED